MDDGDYQITGEGPPIDFTVKDGKVISVRPFHGMTVAEIQAEVARERVRLSRDPEYPEENLPEIITAPEKTHAQPPRPSAPSGSDRDPPPDIDGGVAPGGRVGVEESPEERPVASEPPVPGEVEGDGGRPSGDEVGEQRDGSRLPDVASDRPGSGVSRPSEPPGKPEEDDEGHDERETPWDPLSGEPYCTGLNYPEVGVGVEIRIEGDMLVADFSKPYAFDPVWAALDDLVSEACGQEASWDGLSTLTVPIGEADPEAQARTLWITLVMAKEDLEG